MSQLEVTSPFDQSLIEALPRTDEATATAALERAYEIYDHRGRWLSASQRIDILDRLAKLVEAQVELLAKQAAREGGKPLCDSRVEMQRAVVGISIAKEAVKNLTGQEVPMGLTKSTEDRWAFSYREPRGVVLAISAFNHPFNLLVHQVVTAVAAGCPVVVKPASATPLSCRSLVDLLTEAGLPEGWVQMILTDNEVTARLVSHPKVAFLSFIGSSKVGWQLRSRLAPGASCALEHGGVAPAIVDETADLDDALPLLTKGAFYHAGQVCVSVQRIYAHRSIAESLAESLAERARVLRVGDPLDEQTEVGPLIHPREVDRVHTWVTRAKEGGAKVLCGAKKLSDTLYAPTVLVNPPSDAEVSRLEVFGPVVCVYDYDDIEEAIECANLESEYFQSALFTNRLDRALDIGRRLHGTAVMVNDHTAFRADWMPFGGHRNSGLGLGGIEHSMRDMTIERMIVFRHT
jgi:acyl-CoA reductase-like NAD-dependent aldehyde dehydrogenase